VPKRDPVTLEGFEPLYLVHVAGPLEEELGDNGIIIVQRCLRCDELLAIWRKVQPRPGGLQVGARVGADAYEGISAKRYLAAPELRAFERDCAAVPVRAD
jgi:hypothetical protein